MIWKDNTTAKHYLIPESAILVAGPLKLTTPNGKSRYVEPDAVQPFEISKENAREWLLQQTGDVLEKARHSITATIEEKLQKMREDMAEQAYAQAQTQTAQASEHAEEWKDFLQQLAERFGQQGDDTAAAAARGAQTLFTELFDIIVDAASTNSERQQHSKNSAKNLEDILAELGASTEGFIAELPENIAELLEKLNNEEQTTQLADQLEQLAVKIKENAEKASGQLQQAAEKLRRRATRPTPGGSAT